MQKNLNSSSQIFNKVVDIFFGHKPANPYWLLLAMYLRKNNALAIVHDYEGDDVNIIAPQLDIFTWNTSKHSTDWPTDTNNISIIGNMANNEKLIHIARVFEKASKKNFESINKPGNFLSRFQWEPEFLMEVTKLLLSIDDIWFEHSFNDIFEKVIYRLFSQDRTITFRPTGELDEVMSMLIGTSVNKIYNPFAGSAHLALAANHHCEYIGEDINELYVAIGNLRILSANIDGEVFYASPIHVEDYNADIIVSIPPFGETIDDVEISNMFDGKNDVCTMLIRKCVMTGKRGIIVVPYAVCIQQSGYYLKLREFLMERDCVDAIIGLPSPLFSYTTISTAIFVIDPNHHHKGKIRFISASNLSFEKKETTASIISEAMRSDSDISKLVSLSEISDNMFLLSPESYIRPQLDLPADSHLISISDLGKFIQPLSIEDTPQTGKVITHTFHSKINKIRAYSEEDFEANDVPRRAVRIECDCVMISPTLRTATFISPAEEPIFASSNRGDIFFYTKNEVILPQYLILQFDEEYFKQQLGPSGGVQLGMSSIFRSLFPKAKVIVPSIEEQKKTIEEYQAKLIGDLGMEVSLLKSQRFSEYERNMHLRKHQLKQVMNEVVPAARRIARFVTQQNGDFSKSSIIAERSQATLEQYVVKLFQNVEKINTLISALTDETQFGEPKTIDLSLFMANYRSAKLNEKYDLVYMGHQEFLHGEPEITEEMFKSMPKIDGKVYLTAPAITAVIAPENLTTVLDNIVANALNHGFTNPERLDYAIRIEFRNFVQDGKDMAEIRVKNNGEKLPNGVTPDRIFTWGVGSGTGLGAWQAKIIIEHFGGNIEFIQHDDEPDGFNIEYRLTLPMSE